MCDSPRGALVHLPSAGRAKRGRGAFPPSPAALSLRPQTREAVAPNSSRPAPSGNGITLTRMSPLLAAGSAREFKELAKLPQAHGSSLKDSGR